MYKSTESYKMFSKIGGFNLLDESLKNETALSLAEHYGAFEIQKLIKQDMEKYGDSIPFNPQFFGEKNEDE